MDTVGLSKRPDRDFVLCELLRWFASLFPSVLEPQCVFVTSIGYK